MVGLAVCQQELPASTKSLDKAKKNVESKHEDLVVVQTLINSLQYQIKTLRNENVISLSQYQRLLKEDKEARSACVKAEKAWRESGAVFTSEASRNREIRQAIDRIQAELDTYGRVYAFRQAKDRP